MEKAHTTTELLFIIQRLEAENKRLAAELAAIKDQLRPKQDLDKTAN